MLQKYYSWKKKPNKKKVLKLCKSYRKQQHIQQNMVKQAAKKAKLEINDTEKKNVEKKKEKPIEIDTSVIEDDSEINEREVGFKKEKVNLKDKFEKERENSNKIDGKKSTVND